MPPGVFFFFLFHSPFWGVLRRQHKLTLSADVKWRPFVRRLYSMRVWLDKWWIMQTWPPLLQLHKTQKYICAFTSVLMYTTKNSPEEENSSGSVETSLKKETSLDFPNKDCLRRGKSTLFHLAGGKTGIPTRQSMHKQPWLSSRKFSHWMINRGPGDQQLRSSLSPSPPKFGRSVFRLMKVSTGWPTCTLQH